MCEPDIEYDEPDINDTPPNYLCPKCGRYAEDPFDTGCDCDDFGRYE